MKNDSIKLKLIRMKHDKKQKYCLSEDETDRYLIEQFHVNYEDYLLQRVLIETGCRINAMARIKIENLEFMWDLGRKEYNICIPDSKTGDYLSKIDAELAKCLEDFVERRKNCEFIFHTEIEDDGNRTLKIRNIINNRIKQSGVLPKSRFYTVSVHMFRTTKALRKFRKTLKKAIKRAGKTIGHVPGSGATTYYLNKEDVYH
jgi:integrase